MPGFVVSRGEEFDPGQETRLPHWNLLGNRILLKYKREREREREKAADMDIRKGQKECPLASFWQGVLCLLASLLIR